MRASPRSTFAANVTLYFPGSELNADVLIRERVPIVNYSLGKGDWIAEAVHAYGGKVIATVTTLKHALAAQAEGADALLVTGHEAAGHGGAVTSLALVPSHRRRGEDTGHRRRRLRRRAGLAAALALGAEGVAMGTRFMNTVESPVHEIAEEDERGDVGLRHGLHRPGRRPPGPLCRGAGIATDHEDAAQPAFGPQELPRDLHDCSGCRGSELAMGIVLSGYRRSVQMARMAIGFDAFKKGCTDGDVERGVLPLGQCTGLMNDTPTVAEVVSRTVSEAEEALERAQT